MTAVVVFKGFNGVVYDTAFEAQMSIERARLKKWLENKLEKLESSMLNHPEAWSDFLGDIGDNLRKAREADAKKAVDFL